MKLEDLKSAIDMSARYQEKTATFNANDKIQMDEINNLKTLQFYRGTLSQMESEDKLSINLAILSENISEFFDKQDVLDGSLSCAQYTMPSEEVLKSHAIGVITIIDNNHQKKFYELFDINAKNVSVEYVTSETKTEVDKFYEVNILDVISSYKNADKTQKTEIFQKYPELVDVVFKSLEQTNMAKLNNQHRLISTMVRSALRTTAQARVEKLTRELKNIEEAQQTGFEY